MDSPFPLPPQPSSLRLCLPIVKVALGKSRYAYALANSLLDQEPYNYLSRDLGWSKNKGKESFLDRSSMNIVWCFKWGILSIRKHTKCWNITERLKIWARGRGQGRGGGGATEFALRNYSLVKIKAASFVINSWRTFTFFHLLLEFAGVFFCLFVCFFLTIREFHFILLKTSEHFSMVSEKTNGAAHQKWRVMRFCGSAYSANRLQ